MGDRTLDYVALSVLIFVVITIVYGIIFIHDIPYEIAKKRKHPHQDAIHTAGWVSLFLMHTIWPFLWIWATLYKPGLGWGFSKSIDDAESRPRQDGQADHNEELQKRIDELEKQRNLSEKQIIRKINNMNKKIVRLEGALQNAKEV